MKKLLATHLFLFLLLAFQLMAVVPEGYYDAADAKNGNELRNSLKNVVTDGHYSISYTQIWTAFASTDMHPVTGLIYDMYSNCTFVLYDNQCGGTIDNECHCYNREHTTPRSWFGGAIDPMNTDLFNVYPTDGWVNALRDNYPYGEVGNVTQTSQNGGKLGFSGFTGYSGIVFEPVDEFKGDFARTVMYMATRYADEIPGWVTNFSSTQVGIVYHASNGLTNYARDLFLKWSRNDPVSEKEISRNEAVYSIQGNRNPFIDFPGIEEFIWGSKTAQLFYINEPEPPENQPRISAAGNLVNSGQVIDFGKVDSQTQRSFQIKTAALQGDLIVQVTGTMYTISTSIIPQASAESGYNLTITFNPTTSGTHTGKVTISGGGLVEAFEMNVTGER